jgi:hypothetical protein
MVNHKKGPTNQEKSPPNPGAILFVPQGNSRQELEV